MNLEIQIISLAKNQLKIIASNIRKLHKLSLHLIELIHKEKFFNSYIFIKPSIKKKEQIMAMIVIMARDPLFEDVKRFVQQQKVETL